MTARIRSLAVRYGGIWPWKVNFMVGGTLSQVLPVPRVKAASVLPMPEANWPKAPAVQVWLSVPRRISPGRTWPSSGNALWQTPLLLVLVGSLYGLGIVGSLVTKSGS